MKTAITTSAVGEIINFKLSDLSPAIDFGGSTEGAVTINGVTGKFSIDGENLTLEFDESVAFICGACVEFEINTDGGDGGCSGDSENCDPKKSEITDGLKIATLDDKNCPNGYVLFSDLKAKLKEDFLECDLGEPLDSFPTGANIVVAMSDCRKLLVKPSAVQCDQAPEPFDCGKDE